eukprot:5328031-Pyramimonas_sp.AAC.2
MAWVAGACHCSRTLKIIVLTGQTLKLHCSIGPGLTSTTGAGGSTARRPAWWPPAPPSRPGRRRRTPPRPRTRASGCSAPTVPAGTPRGSRPASAAAAPPAQRPPINKRIQ